MSSEREIVKKLLDSPNQTFDDYNQIVIGIDIEDSKDDIEVSARAVISSYQNANRWLDSIKEILLIDFNLPYFSKIVHELAHEMPKRFDAFGDILHTINRKVPYPSTEEWNNSCDTIEKCVSSVFDILNAIKLNLMEFKEVVERETFTSPLSLLCDPLIIQIQKDYEYYLTIEAQLKFYDNLADWDLRCYEIHMDKVNGNIE